MHPVAKDALSGLLHKMQGEKRESDQEKIADPGIEAGQSEMVEHMEKTAPKGADVTSWKY